MYVLVDYDNVESAVKKLGPLHVAQTIASKIVAHDPSVSRIDFRYYGGWYERSTLTRSAQTLSATIQHAFPSHFVATNGGQRAMLNVELAYALISDPRQHLFNTYRQRNPQESGVRSHHPNAAGCTGAATCGLRHLPQTLSAGCCPEAGCPVLSKQLLYKSEQKLVDVMIACDLLHLISQSSADLIGVATSDHDLWPAIRQALSISSRVVHIQTKQSRTTPPHYRSMVAQAYVELTL